MNDTPDGFVSPKITERMSDAKLATYHEMANDGASGLLTLTKQTILPYEIAQLVNELHERRAKEGEHTPITMELTDAQALRVTATNLTNFYGELAMLGVKQDISRVAAADAAVIRQIADRVEKPKHYITQDHPKCPRAAVWGDVVMIDGVPHEVKPSDAQRAANAEAQAWGG